MDRSARPVGALQPDVAPAAAVEKTATPSPVQTASPANRPAAEPTNIKALWPWFLLALLALLLLWFLLRKKKGTVYATTSRDNAVPLVIEFPDLDLRYPIRPGTMILGSGPDNHIRLDDPDVEEAHAEFCTGPDCELRKLSGSYGVLLNGKEVERSVKLKPGDTLSIGNTKAVIRSAEE